jgi:hypothetical protein
MIREERLSAAQEEDLMMLIREYPTSINAGFLCRVGGVQIDLVNAYLRQKVEEGEIRQTGSWRDASKVENPLYSLIEQGVVA